MDDRGQNTFKEVHLPPYAEFMTQGSVQVAPDRSPETAPEVQYPTSPEVHLQDHYKEAVAVGEAQPPPPPAKDLPATPAVAAAAVPSVLPEKVPDDEEGAAASGSRMCGLSRRSWIIIVAVAIMAIVAIVVGVVVGTRNNKSSSDNSNTDNSQPSQSSSTPTASATPTAVSTPTAADVAIGASFSSSFTFYGSNDEGGSQNCSASRMPCGFHSAPGYTASVSENLFGSIDLGEASISCGTCWRLDAEYDASDRVLNKTIVVMVNNICPAQNNPICGQRTLQEKNEWGGVVDFNLCTDSGAADALFGKGSGIGLAVGKATRVDCDDWDGKTVTP